MLLCSLGQLSTFPAHRDGWLLTVTAPALFVLDLCILFCLGGGRVSRYNLSVCRPDRPQTYVDVVTSAECWSHEVYTTTPSSNYISYVWVLSASMTVLHACYP